MLEGSGFIGFRVTKLVQVLRFPQDALALRARLTCLISLLSRVQGLRALRPNP